MTSTDPERPFIVFKFQFASKNAIFSISERIQVFDWILRNRLLLIVYVRVRTPEFFMSELVFDHLFSGPIKTKKNFQNIDRTRANKILKISCQSVVPGGPQNPVVYFKSHIRFRSSLIPIGSHQKYFQKENNYGWTVRDQSNDYPKMEPITNLLETEPYW